MSNLPSALYVMVPSLSLAQAKVMAGEVARDSRLRAPKLTGRGAAGIRPYYGPGFFGVMFDRDYMWYQEHGTRPFTMTRLAGHTIPMWISDPTGTERAKNPRAKTRRTASGVVQVLIFRRAARHGERKINAQGRSVPKSYPGAPGRIVRRTVVETAQGQRNTGRIAKLTSSPHSGVRWRNPGLAPRHFMEQSIREAATRYGIGQYRIQERV